MDKPQYHKILPQIELTDLEASHCSICDGKGTDVPWCYSLTVGEHDILLCRTCLILLGHEVNERLVYEPINIKQLKETRESER